MEQKQTLPLPPGTFGLPFIGETLQFFTDRHFNQKRIEKYGKVYKTKLFNSPTVMMIGAEANTFLFRNENKYVESTWPKSTRILLGDLSLAVKGGQFHTSRRKLLYQAFQPRALASYIPRIEKFTDQYLAKWEQLQEFTWYPEIRDYTFDIASDLFLSTDGGSQSTVGKLFEEFVTGLFSIPNPFPWTVFQKALKARKALLKELEKIVVHRQKSQQFGNDALGLLIQAKDENGDSLTLEELKDQVLLLLFAGHETLTSAIASFCLLTAQHPDVLAKLRDEQSQLGLTSPLSLEDINQMTYLEQVIKEVMRLIPPVGGGFRKAIQSFDYNGYRIPKGWMLQYQIAQTHQDETIFPDSDRFDPERFSPQRAEDKQTTFAYIPFGGGLRECLGKEFARLEMRIFAAKLLQNYQWDLLPDQNLELITVPTPHPKDGLKVRFTPIKP